MQALGAAVGCDLGVSQGLKAFQGQSSRHGPWCPAVSPWAGAVFGQASPPRSPSPPHERDTVHLGSSNYMQFHKGHGTKAEIT